MENRGDSALSRTHIELGLIKHKAAHKGQLPHGRVIYGYSIHRFMFWQIIGYAIVGVTFSMQPVMRWACEKLEGFWRIIVADVFLFVSFVGTVNGRFIVMRGDFSSKAGESPIHFYKKIKVLATVYQTD